MTDQGEPISGTDGHVAGIGAAEGSDTEFGLHRGRCFIAGIRTGNSAQGRKLGISNISFVEAVDNIGSGQGDVAGQGLAVDGRGVGNRSEPECGLFVIEGGPIESREQTAVERGS